MQSPPSLTALAAAVPEAQNIEPLGEGGFKVAYRAIVGGRLEALKFSSSRPRRMSPSSMGRSLLAYAERLKPSRSSKVRMSLSSAPCLHV